MAERSAVQRNFVLGYSALFVVFSSAQAFFAYGTTVTIGGVGQGHREKALTYAAIAVCFSFGSLLGVVALGRRDLTGGARRHVLLRVHAPRHEHRADLDARQLLHHLDELALRIGAGEMGPSTLPRGCLGLGCMGAGFARRLCA